jgi:hypothetical protein
VYLLAIGLSFAFSSAAKYPHDNPFDNLPPVTVTGWNLTGDLLLLDTFLLFFAGSLFVKIMHDSGFLSA